MASLQVLIDFQYSAVYYERRNISYGYRTIEDQLNYLTHQVSMLRSAVIRAIGEKDTEGEYRPEFVSRILKLARKKKVGVKVTSADKRIS